MTAAMPVLYHNDMSVCGAKVRMALAEKGVNYEGIHLNLRAGDAQRPDYTKLNPNQVVPTLVYDDTVVIESNVICEYIDDRWPDPPLRPDAAAERARMRLWMKRLDDGMHAATGVVSTCVAFRHQHLARQRDEYEAWLAGMVDPARRERTRACVELGLEAPHFAAAQGAFDRLFGQFEQALGRTAWLAGDRFSLADIAYAPYVARLAHLGLDAMLLKRPHVANWASRLTARPAFATGVSQWFNPAYLAIFERERGAAAQKAEELLRSG